MASFMVTPAAKLVGVGLQATGCGIPVGETSEKLIDGLRDVGVPLPPKSWFKPKDKRGKEEPPRPKTPTTIYDKLETHVHGVIQVVRPVIELKRMIREGCCKSADRPAGPPAAMQADQASMNTLHYYTPQKPSSGCCRCSCSAAKGPHYPQLTPPSCGGSEKRTLDRRQLEDSFDESHCVYCSSAGSSTRYLISMPCGRVVCSKCNQVEDHESECRQCKKLKD